MILHPLLIEMTPEMVLFRSLSMFWLLLLSADVILAQSSSYSAYQTSFAYVSSCPSDQYYDIALLQCSPCPANAVQKPNGNATRCRTFPQLILLDVDPTQCDCVSKSFYYGVNQGGGSLLCLLCPSTYVGFAYLAVRTTRPSSIFRRDPAMASVVSLPSFRATPQ